MFPDSKIARKFDCRGQKLKHYQRVIDPHTRVMLPDCARTYFVITTKNSNDSGSGKCAVILVRMHDGTVEIFATKSLDMPISKTRNVEHLSEQHACASVFEYKYIFTSCSKNNVCI